MLSTLYALIPMALSLIGAFLATLYSPKRGMISLLQHFVAGVVIGAVAIELLPKILGQNAPLSIALGFIVGIACMVGLHELAHHLADRQGKAKIPLRLIVAVAIDLLTDGILIGLSFIAGKESGILIALSLSPCAFFLNLTLCSTLRRKNVPLKQLILSAFFVALALPVGAYLGSHVVDLLPAYFVVATISASVAALLYLGVEEFLVEAHATKDNHYTPLSFFFGFFLVLLTTV